MRQVGGFSAIAEDYGWSGIQASKGKKEDLCCGLGFRIVNGERKEK